MDKFQNPDKNRILTCCRRQAQTDLFFSKNSKPPRKTHPNFEKKSIPKHVTLVVIWYY